MYDENAVHLCGKCWTCMWEVFKELVYSIYNNSQNHPNLWILYEMKTRTLKTYRTVSSMVNINALVYLPTEIINKSIILGVKNI